MEYDDTDYMLEQELMKFVLFKENKQRQREKLMPVGNAFSPADSINSGGKRIGPMPDYAQTQLQTRNEVIIQPNDHLFKNHQSNRPGQNLVVPDVTKPELAVNNVTAACSSGQFSHTPVKVHVSHQPTVEDVTRVYNPYPFQHEFENYYKDGFLFEQLKNKRCDKEEAERAQRANVTVHSESIGIYKHHESSKSSLKAKHPVINDKLSTEARVGGGYSNKAYSGGDDMPVNQFMKREPSAEIHRTTTTTSITNHYEQLPQLPRASVAADDHHKYQNDEIDGETDLTNRLYRSSVNNLHIVENIGKEIKKIKTGYPGSELPSTAIRSSSTSSFKNRMP